MGSDGLVESVETGSRQDETTDIRQVGQCKDCQRNSSLPSLLCNKEYDCLLEGCLGRLVSGSVCGVLFEVLVVESAEVVGILGLVLLDIGVIDPTQRVHEPGVRVSTTLCLAGASLHVVEGGGDVTHHGHQEEGHLKDRVLQEVQALNDTVIPGRVLHVDKKREGP